MMEKGMKYKVVDIVTVKELFTRKENYLNKKYK